MAHPCYETAKESERRALHRYADGGRVSDKEQDKEMTAKGIHQHEDHEHGGEHTSLKLHGGGKIQGYAVKQHLGRRARGGRSSKGPARVNIVIATGGDRDQQRPPVVAPPPPPPAVPPPPPRPPMPAGMPPGGLPPGMMPPGAGMPPGGGAPMMRPPMQRGGRTGYPHPNAGGGGGKGRLEKMRAYGMADGGTVSVRAHSRRKAGGRVD